MGKEIEKEGLIMSRLRLRFSRKAHAILFKHIPRFHSIQERRDLIERAVVCSLTEYSFIILESEWEAVENFLTSKFFFRLERDKDYFISFHA